MNLWPTEVVYENETYRARRHSLDIAVPVERGEKAAALGGEVLLGIRAEDIEISDQGITGEVYVVEPLGRDDLLTVKIGDVNIFVLADPDLDLRMGDTVHLSFNSHKVQFFDPKTERSLLW
jgi:ABC-type sugar transport system ATPase subunit